MGSWNFLAALIPPLTPALVGRDTITQTGQGHGCLNVHVFEDIFDLHGAKINSRSTEKTPCQYVSSELAPAGAGVAWGLRTIPHTFSRLLFHSLNLAKNLIETPLLVNLIKARPVQSTYQ